MSTDRTLTVGEASKARLFAAYQQAVAADARFRELVAAVAEAHGFQPDSEAVNYDVQTGTFSVSASPALHVVEGA